MLGKIVIQMGLALVLALPVVAKERVLELYFSNDSMNAFQLSDAYETHDMGARYTWGQQFVDLNLGLVSPDMWLYKNQYRTANRSFGELVTVSYGLTGVHERYGSYELMARMRATGDFGLDAMQDFMHGILNLQPVGDLEARVRMPSAVWFGLGAATVVPDAWLGSDLEGGVYLGSDRVALKGGLGYQLDAWRFGVAGEYVLYDDVVSAAPVSAVYRTFIPSAYVQLQLRVIGKTVTVKNRISLPTIESDGSVFGVLSMALELPLN